ncbi:putative nuclease HARBI1 [Musca domestica]|uniref:Nuclease HARBI1 n=1 Tax=Musca domestica TaxID=7370 RepID=A0ABM3UMG5_MUSDO|nr:putative nuclease HARBI1 [Musca domestica]
MWIIISAIGAEICPHWIKLRMSSEEKRKSKLYFFENYEIPGIVGCIDGTHVRMVKPSEDESLFYNRKGTFSMNAMIVSKPTPFSLPGSCHDAFIWNLSGARQFFLNQYEDGDRNSWLLGDSGYGLELFLMTPYRDVSVGTKEHKFNKKHTLTRSIIERTIGVLKSSF